MAQIILVAHGFLAVEMKNSLEMIFGENDRFHPIAFEKQDGLESLEEKLKATLDRNNEPTLIMADLFCGTPYNASCSIALKEEQEIQVISGMSLPLVLEAASLIETESINEIACKMKELAGQTVQCFTGELIEEEEEL
ncbi:PTS sugar transporter subunit IIA [Enterococcus sp. BWR-S5]|uniref:PTS sugar transporter subunit IIA n=1 Tax=Enterococcus sp. BWR-S5 TaxID=2787714 RepID=UPI00192409FC|nr:PTS sugar transporter subunit IIA [Enterococcus sp. BWR-S5]MBL1226231.1 PTS sugar transporter subunit IIA [Enterococcus sp. BWR-S5]